METRAIKGSPINADQYVVEDEAVTATLGRSPAIAGVGALVALGGMFIMAGCSDHSGRPGIVSTKTSAQSLSDLDRAISGGVAEAAGKGPLQDGVGRAHARQPRPGAG